MLQQIEHILETHPDAFIECQRACKALDASYIAHYATATPSAVTAMTSAYPGHSLIIAGTRKGTVHAISLNSAASTLSIPSYTEPGMLAPTPVSDLAPLDRCILAARGRMLTKCCMDSSQIQTIPTHAPISSLSTIPNDHNTALLGFMNGTFGWLDLRSNNLMLHKISRFGFLSTCTQTINDIPRVDACSCDSKVCAKQHTEASKKVFISVEKPGIPARIWDQRSTSAICNIVEPSVENGRILWGEFSKTHLAVISSNDAVFFYNHRRNYLLEYYSHVTTRHSARAAWIDDCRLIPGTYSRMRETDQRGFPIIAVPDELEDGTEPLKDAPLELAYEWVNCPFQTGTSALYPFSSKSLPILNTFYGVAMENSICVLNERPRCCIMRGHGPTENHYESGFSHCSDTPLGLPKRSFHRDTRPNTSSEGYCSNISNSLDWALRRWGAPVCPKSSDSVSFFASMLDSITSHTNMIFSTSTLSSSLSQSDKLGVSQDIYRTRQRNEYARYSYPNTCRINQFTQEKENVSTSPPLKIDQAAPRHFIPWQVQQDSECTQRECLEVDSLFDREETDCNPQSDYEINFDDT